MKANLSKRLVLMLLSFIMSICSWAETGNIRDSYTDKGALPTTAFEIDASTGADGVKWYYTLTPTTDVALTLTQGTSLTVSVYSESGLTNSMTESSITSNASTYLLTKGTKYYFLVQNYNTEKQTITPSSQDIDLTKGSSSDPIVVTAGTPFYMKYDTSVGPSEQKYMSFTATSTGQMEMHFSNNNVYNVTKGTTAADIQTLPALYDEDLSEKIVPVQVTSGESYNFSAMVSASCKGEFKMVTSPAEGDAFYNPSVQTSSTATLTVSANSCKWFKLPRTLISGNLKFSSSSTDFTGRVSIYNSSYNSIGFENSLNFSKEISTDYSTSPENFYLIKITNNSSSDVSVNVVEEDPYEELPNVNGTAIEVTGTKYYKYTNNTGVSKILNVSVTQGVDITLRNQTNAPTGPGNTIYGNDGANSGKYTIAAGETWTFQVNLSAASYSGTRSFSVNLEDLPKGTSRDNPLAAVTGTNTVPTDLGSATSLWYSYTPTKTGYIKVTSTNMSVSFYEGTSDMSISSSPISDGSTSSYTYTVDVTAGTQYLINFNGGVTSFTLAEGEYAAGETYSNPISITAGNTYNPTSETYYKLSNTTDNGQIATFTSNSCGIQKCTSPTMSESISGTTLYIPAHSDVIIKVTPYSSAGGTTPSFSVTVADAVAGQTFDDPITINSGDTKTLTTSTFYKITNGDTEQVLNITTTGDVNTMLYDGSSSMMTQPLGSTSCSVAAGQSVIIYATVTAMAGSPTTATMTATLSTPQAGDTKGLAKELSTTTSNTVSGDTWFKYTCSSTDVNKYLVLSSDDDIMSVSYQVGTSTTDSYFLGTSTNVKYLQMTSADTYYIHFKNVSSTLSFNASISESAPVAGLREYPMTTTGNTAWLESSTTERWFKYTSTSSGTLTITPTNTESKITAIELYASNASGATAIATATGSPLTLTYASATASTTYYIKVTKTASTDTGESITISCSGGSTPSGATGESYSNPIIITSGVQQTLTADTYYKITNSGTSEQLLKITTTGDVYTTLYDASNSMMQPLGSTSCTVAVGQSVIIYASVMTGSTSDKSITATLSAPQAGDTKDTAIDLSTTAVNTVSGEKWFKYTCASTDENKYLVLSSDDNMSDVYYQTSSSTYDSSMSYFSANVKYLQMISADTYYIHFTNVTSVFTFNAAISSSEPVKGSQAYPMDVTSSGWLEGSTTERWFKYTPTSSGTLTITPTNDTSSNITAIELYASNASGAASIATASGSPLTLTYASATASTTYYIRVTKTVSSDPESVSISLTVPGTSSSYPLIATTGTNTVPSSLTLGQPLWYSFTPQEKDYIEVKSTSTNVYFYDGESMESISSTPDVESGIYIYKIPVTKGIQYLINFNTGGITSFSLKEGADGDETDPYDANYYKDIPDKPGTYWYRYTCCEFTDVILSYSAGNNTATLYSTTDHVNPLNTVGAYGFTKKNYTDHITFDIKVVKTTNATGEKIDVLSDSVTVVPANVYTLFDNEWYKFKATKSGTMTVIPNSGFGVNQADAKFDCYVDDKKISSTPVYNATSTNVVDAIKYPVDAGKTYYLYRTYMSAALLYHISFRITNEGIDAVTVTNSVGTPTTTDGVETSAATAAVTALASNTATSSFVDTGAAEAVDMTSTTSEGKSLSDIIKAAGSNLTEEQKTALTSENIKTKMSIAMKSATVGKDGENACVNKVAFDIKPTAVVVMDGVTADINATVPNDLITKPITFRLPVDANYTATFVKVYHKGDAQSSTEDNLGLYEVKTEVEGDNISKYIELSQQSFSEYGYESNNFDPTNINFAEVYLGKSTKETGDVSLSQWATKLQSYPNAVGIVASSDNISDWAMNQKNVIIRSGSEGNYTYVCPNFVLTDIQDLTEGQTADFYTPCNFTATAGSYSRKPNAVATSTVLFNSVCLPFELQSTDLSTSAKILTWDSHTESTVTLKDVSGNLAAGTPCIIYDEATAWNTINLAGKTIVGTPVNSNKMEGTFVNTTSYGKSGGQATTDYYSVNVENKFQTLAGNLSPFRSCIYLGTEGSGAKSIVVIDGVDNETTGVENIISTENKASSGIYNLNGCKVGNDINSLPRGMYIIGGKKVLIK